MRTRLLFCLALALTAGCGAVRIFQRTVPNDTQKPVAQAESEKRAADFIVKKSAPPVANPEEAVATIHAVALGLSSSLGPPEKPVTLEDQAAIIAELRGGLLAKEAQLEKWKAFGRKYAGKEIEGTGFDLSPFLGWGGLLAIIAGCIFVPGFGWVLLRFVPVIWGMLRRLATGVEGFAKAHATEGNILKHEFLEKTMNEVDKKIVARRKKKVPAQTVDKLAADAVSVAA